MRPELLPNQDKPDALTIMAWPLSTLWGQALKECVSDPFTAATGIPVKHVEFTGVDVPIELLKACQKGQRPPCDVLYCNTIPAIHMAQSGFTDELSIDEFPILESLTLVLNPLPEDFQAGRL